MSARDRVGANVEVRGNRISRCHQFLLFKAIQILSACGWSPLAHDIALSRSLAEKRKVLSSIADHPALPIEVAHAVRIHPAACSIKGPFALSLAFRSHTQKPAPTDAAHSTAYALVAGRPIHSGGGPF